MGETSIRKAVAEDVARMVELSEQKRWEYATYQPRFWRPAADSRERQKHYFARLVGEERTLALVHEQNGVLDGFIIAAVVPAPPVYDPGGLTCLIDDFVAAPDAWSTTGAALLAEVSRQAKERGAVQTVVVCGQRDEPKRRMLGAGGHSIASEWYVREIDD